jgi:hypothetical protein
MSTSRDFLKNPIAGAESENQIRGRGAGRGWNGCPSVSETPALGSREQMADPIAELDRLRTHAPAFESLKAKQLLAVNVATMACACVSGGSSTSLSGFPVHHRILSKTRANPSHDTWFHHKTPLTLTYVGEDEGTAARTSETQPVAWPVETGSIWIAAI